MVTQAEIDIVIDAKNKAQAEITRLKSQLASVSKETAAAGKAMSSASSSSSGFASSLKSVASAANPVSAAMRGVTGAVGTATKALGAIGLAGIGIQTVTGAVSGLGNALGFGLQNELEQVRASMNAFFKDSGKTEEALKMIRQEANATPFAFREMAVAMSSLLPVAKQSNTEIMDLVKTAEILAASNPFEGLEGASFALREAMSGDFTSIIERFNLSRTTINKLKEEGVPALEIVRRAMGEMGFDADLVAAKANTLSGRWSTFNDTLDTLRLKLSEGLFEAANRGLDIMSGALDKNMPKLEAMATTIGEGVGTALSFALDKIVEFAGAVETHWGTISTILSTGWDVLRTVGETVFSVVVSAVQTAAGLIVQAWGPVSSALVAVWDMIGPKAVAAGAAIISGLTAAQSWITDTLLPKIGELAGAAWDAIGPKATAAAQAITDALGSIVSWVESNWPAVKEQLSGVFDRLAETAGPAIEEVKQRLSELEQRMGETDQQSRELFREGSAFDRLAEQIASVDFSPLTSQFAPLKNEAQAWVDFLGQDFGPAMEGARGVLGFVKQSINDVIPDWANLGNAAQAGAVVVVGAVNMAVSAAEHASAGIRAALQLVIDLLSQNWSAAFGSAVSAASNLGQALPPVAAAAEGLRAVLSLLGQAASAAAGFVSGLASGIGSVAGAAANALGPLNGVLGLLDKIGGAKGALDFVLPGSLPPLAQGFSDVGDQASRASFGLQELGGALGSVGQFQTNTLSSWARSTVALVEYTGSLREAERELRDLNAELRQLKLAQALDPANEALAEQIKGLTFTVQVQRDLVATLKESVAGWQAETFAVDGFVQALNTLSEAGPQALKIQEQFVKALTENDFAAGSDLAAGIQKMIADAAQSLEDAPELLAPIQALGEQVLAAFRAALEAPSEETIGAAMGLLSNLTTAITDATAANAEAIAAAGTLTAETFAAAFAGEESKAALGSAGVAMMEALATAMTEGGVTAIEKAADTVTKVQDELQKLPEFVRGKLGADFKMALDAFLAAPSQEGLDRLRPIIQQINQALELIPKNMADLAPDVVREIEAIIQAFLDMGLSAEEAAGKIEATMQRAASSAKSAASDVSSAARGLSAAQEAALTQHLRGRPGPTGPMPILPLPKADLFAMAAAGHNSEQTAAVVTEYLERLAQFQREEQARIRAALDQQEQLRQLSLKIGAVGGVAGQDRANQILTQLSAGLIGIDDAIRMLIALLSELATKGLKATVAAGEVGLAARDYQTQYERARW